MIKLGPHVQQPTPEARQWARVAGIVKTIDDLTVFSDAPANAIRIFRHYDANENSNDAEGTVNAVISALNGYSHPNLYLQLWTGAHPPASVLYLAVFLCHQHGYKTIGSSWYTGDYTQDDWDQATAAGVDAYGPQAYFGNKGFTLDHAVRYRRFHQDGQKPVLIPECGRDAIEGGGPGYLDSKINGIAVSSQQYVSELVAYNAELNRDAYVLGACVFTAGPTTR